MKLVLQIALGVFLGSLASILLLDVWQQHKATLLKAETDRVLAEQEIVRENQAKLLSNILQQGRQSNPAAAITPPVGFIPDDAQTGTPRP
jgi:hypothetical protein